MKTLFHLLLCCIPAIANAGGAATGGATEWTQIMNNIQLADSYAQDVNRYQNEIMRYELMVRNIQNNPAGVALPNLNQLVQNQAKIMQYGSDIGTNMANVDKNFSKQFNNPQAQSFGVKFAVAANTSMDALKAAMLNVGLQHETAKTDAENLQALVDRAKTANGDKGALDALNSINAAQLAEAQRYRQLFADQSMATNTALAAQAAQGRDAQAQSQAVQSGFADGPISNAAKLSNTHTVYKTLDLYTKKK